MPSTTFPSHSAPSLPLGGSRSGIGRLPGIGRLFAVWRSRRALSRLDDALLRDIGVTRAEADAEVRRPAWDVPANWRR